MKKKSLEKYKNEQTQTENMVIIGLYIFVILRSAKSRKNLHIMLYSERPIVKCLFIDNTIQSFTTLISKCIRKFAKGWLYSMFLSSNQKPKK